MTILCGTDFSLEAARAATAAAYLARARRTSLVLVHALDVPGAEEVLAQGSDSRVQQFFQGERERLLRQLEAEAARLAPIGAPIECQVLVGRADEAVVEHGLRRGVELVVVGAIGKRGASLWRLGSTSDRVAQTTTCPVLVVRDDEPWRAWAAGERLLRVVVGVDSTSTSDAAVRWLSALLAAGPCTLIAAHVYWPPALREAAGASGLPIGVGHAGVEAALERDLRARLAALASDHSIQLEIVGGLGRAGDHLAQIAGEQKADVLVVGTHQRGRAGRMWHGSVSRDAVVAAPCSVIVVPGS